MRSYENILEAIAEALRQSRRSYVKPFDLSSIRIDINTNQIQLDIMDDGQQRIFALILLEQPATDA